MIGARVVVVSYCVTEGCFAAIVGVVVVQRPCCCGWLEGSSSIMLTWVCCVCCVCCGVIVVVVFLSSIFACGGNFWVCFIVTLMALYWVSLVFVCNCCLLVLVMSCLSSSSGMRCGSEGLGLGLFQGSFVLSDFFHS